ncbi:MAG: thioesterase [Marinilabiliales bacterium]|nr:MAG: thioesterase [Marinilabiliales bacterium]
MRKISNPYNKLEGHYCFACSDKNQLGLKMEFYEDGEYVISKWKAENHYQGFHNILHGGIQATLMDELAAWFVQIKMKTSGVTSSMNTKYIHPVNADEQILLRASLQSQRKNIVEVKVELIVGKETVCTQSDITYYTFPQEIAKKKFYYPEYKEFFEND